MGNRIFTEMLKTRWAESKFVCVGLDSEFNKIPNSVWRSGNGGHVDIARTQVAFNRAIVEATADLVLAYKLNAAFYRKIGADGTSVLQKSIADIHAFAPGVPVILDAKYGDVENTNAASAEEVFDYLEADAVTVNPLPGREALKPFLVCKEKGIIVLCRMSNPGAGEFQDLESGGMPFYEIVARHVANAWNVNGNCGVVVGATRPDELRQIRSIVGDIPILMPGVGTQGGDVEESVKAGKDSRGEGMIINSSRGIIFASNGDDFAKVARRKTEDLTELINRYR